QSRYSHCIGRHRIHARNAKMARAPACGRPFSPWLAAAGCLTIGLSPHLSPTGEWFLHSGIQQPDGGVARCYLAEARRNLPASTEITGYAVSAFVYLRSVTHDARYLERAVSGARFLIRAWDPASETM